MVQDVEVGEVVEEEEVAMEAEATKVEDRTVHHHQHISSNHTNLPNNNHREQVRRTIWNPRIIINRLNK